MKIALEFAFDRVAVGELGPDFEVRGLDRAAAARRHRGKSSIIFDSLRPCW